MPFDPPPAAAGRDDRQFMMFARTGDGFSLDEAAREIAVISARLAAEHPSTNDGWETFPVSLRRLHGRDSRGTFIMLQAAVGVVLLIACANIANLLLARGTKRRREIAVRLALGAGRGRLVRGLLVESLLLSGAGSAIGVLLALWAIPVTRAMGGFPDVIEPALNLGVLAFTALAGGAAGVLTGIVPALRSSTVPPASVLRAEDGRAGHDGASGWMRSALVVVQVACALVLATSSALTLRSIINRQSVDLGFEPRGAVRGEISLTGDRYQTDPARRTAANAILDALSAAPEVQTAGVATWALPTGAGARRVLSVPARNDAALNPDVRRGIEAVTPGYFEAMGTALVSGRFFTSADRAGGEAVALINEELARQLWPAGNAIGELLRLGTVEEGAPVVRIVGTVGTIRRSPMHDIPVARVYVPYDQYPGPVLSIVARTRGNLAAAERALEAAARRADPDLMVEGLRTLDADMAQFVAPLRLVTWVLTGFAAAGVLLAALGVFGTMSYNVMRRQRDLAIRSALGATGRDIFSLVFAGALRLTAAGLAIGIAATLAVTRALASFLFGVSPTDPATIASAALVLALAALGACYLPARLAATADPLPLLRRE